jgi:hypothetical protein
VRLQLHAPAYNLATFLRCIEPPEEMAQWLLTSLQLKLFISVPTSSVTPAPSLPRSVDCERRRCALDAEPARARTKVAG